MLEQLDRAVARVEIREVVYAQPDRRPAEPHQCHPIPRLTFITGGRKHIAMGGVDEAVDRRTGVGTAIFMPARSWTRPVYDSAREFIGIVFRGDYTRYLLSRHDGRSAPPSSPDAWFHVPATLAGAGPLVLQALAARAREARHRPPGAADVRLFAAMLQLAREHLAAAADHEARGGALATWQSLCEHVRDHHHRPIDRTTVAKAFGLHPNYVSTLFAAQGGESFARFLARVRLERAAELLKDPEAVVGKVAAAVGYADPGYFVKAFRRAYGTTPGRFGRGS